MKKLLFILFCILLRVASAQAYTDAELLAMAGNKYADGELPLGDGHYVLDAPRKGYIYLCHPMREGHGGAGNDGPWIHGTTWNIYQKIPVRGNVAWPDAQFSNSITGDQRLLSGNDLPVTHATGQFPVQPSDPAYSYDRNPNSIAAQALHDTLPLNPAYSDTPYCMGGEAGVMLTGVYLFNGFDAGMRDAAAHELQDSCNGHPQVSGQYHYHSLSACIKGVSVKTVIGYALDGFPITGPMVASGKYLTTDNLDVCHGLTSDIIEDGVKKTTYHYVMTQDFPYSVSCFRGKPTRTGPSDGGPRRQQGQGVGQQGMDQQQGMPGGQRRMPPPEAIAACNGQPQGASCSFITPRGDQIQGSCDVPTSAGYACKP